MRASIFHLYTTCGYKVFLKNESKKVYAYFLCNSLKEAVEIPTKGSCYHMFGANIGRHQTAVQVTFDGTNVCFKDDDLFILAWGRGDSIQT